MGLSPPVVLLHGWGGSFETTWQGWPAALQDAGRSVIKTMLPGHGKPASIDPAAYSDLAGELDRSLPNEVLDVVGFSLGGKLALAIAARDRGRFRRVVVGGVGDNLFSPEPAAEAVLTAMERGIGEDTPPAAAEFVRYTQLGGADPAALAAVLRRPSNPVLSERDLADVHDVLLVNGDADEVAMPDARLEAALPNAETRRLEGVDHLSLPSSPAFRLLALRHLRFGPERPRESQ